MKRIEIRLAGFGGQGILTAGRVLARAVIYEGGEIAQSETYSSAVRRGPSTSDIIISDEPIDYPIAEKLDYLVVMSQEACDIHTGQLNPDGVLFFDPRYVKNITRKEKYVEVPATDTAISDFGDSIAANMIMVGAFISSTKLISKDSVQSAIIDSLPKAKRDTNLKALERGFQILHETLVVNNKRET